MAAVGRGVVTAQAPTPNGALVISQVYGGGGNTGAPFTNDFVELFNRGGQAVSLSGLSVQYASATGTGNFSVGATLTGTLEPGQYFLVQMAGGANGVPLPVPDATGTSAMSGTAGKVALAVGTTSLGCNGGSTPCSPAQLANLVDLVGYGGANFFEGSAPAAGLSNTTAAQRLAGGCTDTNSNGADFTVNAPAPRNSATALASCTASSNPTVTVSLAPPSVEQGRVVVIAAAVAPGSNPASSGLAVAADLSALGASPDQALLDDGIAPDAVAGDFVFTTSLAVSAAQAPGSYGFTVTVSDAELRSGTFSGSISVIPPPVLYLPHDVQGPGAISPFPAGTLVTVEGVVTGVRTNAFFIQTAPGREDSDPLTSEGLLVFSGSAPPATAAVGNLVQVTGRVTEFVPGADPTSPPVTELTTPSVLLVGTSPLPAPVALDTMRPSPAGPFDQLEPLEGMRVTVPSLTAVSGTAGNISEANATATSNGVFYGVVTGNLRPFREAGIQPSFPVPPCAAGADCAIPRFDGNPERIRVDSDGLLGVPAVNVSTGAVLMDVTGPLDYGFRTYTILPESPLTATGGTMMRPVPLPGDAQFTVASFNLQRFYDTVNDPGTSDVVLTAAALERRLAKASDAVRTYLRAPDVVAVQEMENLPVLQLLASRLNADAGLACPGDEACYTAYLTEGNDIGGIDVGFLATTRVTVHEVQQWGRDVLYSYPDPSSPTGAGEALMNDRPSLSLRATVQGPAHRLPADVIVVVNHLRSLNGVDDPADGPRVRAKRQAQAEFLAGVLDDLQETWPSTTIVSVGDYNAFEVSDGFVDVMGTVRGTPAPPTTVVNASPDLVDPDFVDAAFVLPAAERYSYVFDGSAQSLDHVLFSANALGTGAGVAPFAGLAHARINADFPEVARNSDTAERLSDHDPAVAYFTFPADRVPPVLSGTPGDITVAATSPSGAAVGFVPPTANDNLDGPVPVTCSPAPGAVLPVGETVVTCTAMDAAGNTASQSFVVRVTVPDDANGLAIGAGQLQVGTRHTLFAFTATRTAAREGGVFSLVSVAPGAPVGTFLSGSVSDVVFWDDGSVTFTAAGRWNGVAGAVAHVRARDGGRNAADALSVVVRTAGGSVVLDQSAPLRAGTIVRR